MNDFFISIFRGLYPPFLFFLVWGIAVRIHARRWRKFDTLLLAGFLCFELLASVQVFVFYGELTTSKRYMWIGIPLYLPIAAQGVVSLSDLLKRNCFGRLSFIAGLTISTMFSLYNSCTPIIKEHLPCQKSLHRRVSMKAAEWIRRDWKPAPDAPALSMMKCDQYNSGRRPLVQSEWERVGYLCGGQQIPKFFLTQGLRPDYILTEKKSMNFPGYVRVGAVTVETETAYIHKRREIDEAVKTAPSRNSRRN